MFTRIGQTLGAHSSAGGAALMALALLAAPVAQAKQSEAEAILKAMTQYVASQQTIEFSYDSSIEIITPHLEKIQFTNSGSGLLSRPDKLRAHRVGGYADVEVVFDGKQLSILGKNLNGYLQVEAKGTLDELIQDRRANGAFVFPGADLLLSNAYEVLTAGVLEAKHIGRGVIDGKECEHLAFRNFDTDWQIWVAVGEQPAPCKMVVTSKTLSSGPQYTLQIKSWKTGVTPAEDAFTFTPPAGAVELGAEAMAELDELPPSAPAGAKK